MSHFFSLPNAVFTLGLSANELAVYAYLLYCEDRATYQCYPSYQKIGKAVSLSKNTVAKCVRGLEEKGLITIAPTKIKTGNGVAHNGSLLYTVLPIQSVVDFHNEQQFVLASTEAEIRKHTRQMEKKFDPQQVAGPP